MAAGRRVSHRSASAPGLEGDSRGLEPDGLSSTIDVAQLSSSRPFGPNAADTDKYSYNEPTNRLPQDARRSGSGGIDSGLFSSTVPGTLPSSNGHAFKYNNVRKYGGERLFQIDDDDVAAALLVEAPSALMEVDRRTGYQYLGQGARVRSGSAPVGAETGSSSPPLLSPNPARLDPVAPATMDVSTTAAAPAPVTVDAKPRREKKRGKEEKKRRHHSSRRSRTSVSGVSRGGNAETASEPMASSSSAWFSGMTAAQQVRFESLQERSNAGHELARWKMLEFMRHWMSAQGTRSSVDAVISEVLADAGLVKIKGAWGSAGSGASGPGLSPVSPSNKSIGGEGAATVVEAAGAAAANGAMTASPPTSEPPPEKVSPKNQLIAKTATPATSDDAAPSAGAQTTAPALEELLGKLEDSTAKEKTPRSTVEGEIASGPPSLLALADGGTVNNDDGAFTSQTVETASSALPVGSALVTAVTQPSVSPHRRQYKKDETAVVTAKEGAQRQQCVGTQVILTKEGGGGSTVKNVDEGEDELLQSSATPKKQVAPVARNGSGASPETAAASLKTDASLGKMSPHKPLSESTTPQRTPSEAPLRSPRAFDSAVRRSRSRSTSLKEAAKRQAATYDEIPRFYFPLGRPTTSAQAINGPLSKNHENPHLKVMDGVPIAAAMYDGEEGGGLNANAEVLINGNGEDAAFSSEARRGPKVAPMSNLHLLEDKHVAHHIQREFGRLPPFPKHSSKVRLLGGRARSGTHHNSNLSYAKQELLYKQQFIQCAQRVCSQCFGVPRYFAFIILRLIQWMANNGAVDVSGEGSRPQTRHTGNSRIGSSSSLLSHTTNGSSGAGSGSPFLSLFHITPQHLKDFYDAHLRNKDAVRRVFDLLILSSRLPNSSAAAASLAATNAAAVTTVADQQSDASTPRNSEAALLRPYLLPKDFVAYIDVLLTQHPGLAFLRQTPDFQTKYLDTVIYRIYYELDRFDRGSIRYAELAASRLIDAFRQVDAAEDINSVLLFFSYEHFYVLYCRFWELDEDRDMLLAPEDLMRYAPEDVMNPAIVQRVFTGVGRRLRCAVPQRIGYEDFVWFCLSEEDKSTPQAIRYWFRVLDLDGDGVLSVYELREFYDATRNKIAQYVQEGLVTFEDVVCQVFDMMRCPEYRGLYLCDLLREPEAAAVALNMLTNVVKFLQFEQRDPFVSHQERLLGGLEQSAWDRFARLEYDRMALETDEEG
ncbi:hypothetical protein ABB37_07925 [Leptomonas pyrrhocoris]|uniref:EF-hand domain-containing protein n=1 Tax=Leptomonas pyrrhocoris TaxID=157538 RepID=A0A0M9FU67_LEPPY|nr:hypothetical protein ABB37_07925 [Leptomonas pyrrhocoris]KPA76165.1 hypothetical protein ABB37_07925 [Leptomonas pyrrhocoris]|eukprot:XP_015654604.1 hypothetical protein ABB37_07925 [Leptomonas pyrrhocoris]